MRDAVRRVLSWIVPPLLLVGVVFGGPAVLKMWGWEGAGGPVDEASPENAPANPADDAEAPRDGDVILVPPTADPVDQQGDEDPVVSSGEDEVSFELPMEVNVAGVSGGGSGDDDEEPGDAGHGEDEKDEKPGKPGKDKPGKREGKEKSGEGRGKGKDRGGGDDDDDDDDDDD